MNQLLRQISTLLQPLNRRLMDVVARAVVERLDDSKEAQLAQLGILDGEVRDTVERFQNYGFTSVPLEGAEAVVLSVGGHRDHCLVVAMDDRRYRLRDLEPGEVAVFHKDGAKVHLKADGSVELTSKDGAKLYLQADGTVAATPKSGSDVVLAEGTAKVVRVGDSTGTGSLSMLTAPVPGTPATLVTFQWTPEGGGVPQIIGTITLTTAGGTAKAEEPVALVGKTTSGAEHVKA